MTKPRQSRPHRPKILLTGGSGNLGQSLQRQGEKYRWAPLGRNDWDQLPKLARGAQYVIHAASDLVTPISRDPRRAIDSNLNSTIRLLEHLSTQPVDRLVFISSCAVYGRNEVTREDVTPTPITINGITKLLNEEIIKEYCRAYNIPYQIVRVFNTYGGQDRFSILSHLRRAIETGAPFKIYNQGASHRDFVHVDDTAAIVMSLLERPLKATIVNVGTGETNRIRDVVKAVQRKYPKLLIEDAGPSQEIEYSRADLTLLRTILPNYQFRSVLDFIDESF